MIRRLTSRTAALAAAAALALTVAGSALAFWQGSGSGNGEGSTGTTLPIALTAGVADAQLYPGGQSGVTLVMSNPNPTSVSVGSLALASDQGTGGFAINAGHAGCVLSTLTYSTQTNAGTGWTVPGESDGVPGSLSVTLANALAMGAGAANACQNGVFTVYLVAGP